MTNTNLPDLTPVINWLENGCDPKEAAKELRLHQQAIDALKQSLAKPVQEWWLPIENPPEKWTEVIVWPHPTDYCMTAEFDGDGWQYSEEDRDGAFWSACKPTHWMPLPAAPSQQNKGDCT